MKPAVLYLTVAVVAAVAGAGGAYGVMTLVKPPAEASAGAKPEAPVVPEGPWVILPEATVEAPLVFEDGRLAGYAKFTFQLEVAEKDAARVTEELPILMNAINLRTYRSPLARDPDGQIPDLEVFRRILEDSQREAFGPGLVRRVLITEAMPDR